MSRVERLLTKISENTIYSETNILALIERLADMATAGGFSIENINYSSSDKPDDIAGINNKAPLYWMLGNEFIKLDSVMAVHDAEDSSGVSVILEGSLNLIHLSKTEAESFMIKLKEFQDYMSVLVTQM